MATLWLAGISSAEICRISQTPTSATDVLSPRPDWHYAIVERVSVDREFILDYWSRLCDLPSAESARCHIPAFGILFLSDDAPVGAATICWRCNNIYVAYDKLQATLTFDGTSTSARVLLEQTEAMFEES